jgi:DNA-binding MarR family transcriptional regulator
MPTSDRAKDLDSLVDEIVDLFHEVWKARGRSTTSAWMDLQLTLPQFKMLVVVSQSDSSTVGCIAEHLGVGESTASYLVERLVQADLVERAEDPSDRRRAMIRLSRDGRALLEKLVGPQNWPSAQLRDIGIEDLAALRRGLEAVVSMFKEIERK